MFLAGYFFKEFVLANLASQDLLINIKFTIPLSMILSLDQFILWIFVAKLSFSRLFWFFFLGAQVYKVYILVLVLCCWTAHRGVLGF